MLQHADSGLQFLRALKVLHLDIRHIKGQLESKSLEVLKLTCHTMEHSKPKANLGPLGYLPQLNTVEIKARLTTRTVSTFRSTTPVADAD